MEFACVLIENVCFLGLAVFTFGIIFVAALHRHSLLTIGCLGITRFVVDFHSVLHIEHKDIECIVSPANSFGYMDGGYDKAITDYFGVGVEKEAQKFINSHLFGEQPVGTSIMVDIPNTNKKLIHTPTMRLPSTIKDELVIYQCMRSTLSCAIKGKVHSIVIPAFGGATGKVKPDIIAKYMKAGYDQILEHIKVNGSAYKL